MNTPTRLRHFWELYALPKVQGAPKRGDKVICTYSSKSLQDAMSWMKDWRGKTKGVLHYYEQAGVEYVSLVKRKPKEQEEQ